MSKIKNILIFLGIALVLILIYVFVFKKSPDQPSLISSSGNAVLPTTTQNATSTISQDFLAVLLSVKNIKIDDSIFSDPAFLSLNDSTIELVSDGTEGRQNPFAPLGSDASAIPAPVISTIPDNTPTLPTIPDTGSTNSGTTGN
jgi:hypothetical protein